MPDDDLKPDPDALEKWRQMPQSDPSKDALPPATGGLNWAWGFILVLGAIVLIAIVVQYLV